MSPIPSRAPLMIDSLMLVQRHAMRNIEGALKSAIIGLHGAIRDCAIFFHFPIGSPVVKTC